jgi:methyl-accepting chemotaxis protein
MGWYGNLKTSVKLISAFVLVSLILAAVGVYAISNLSMMNAQIEDMYETNLIPIRDLSAAETSYNTLRVTLRDIALSNSRADMDKLALTIPSYKKDIVDNFNTYRNSFLTPEEKAELKVFDKEWAAYEKLYDTAVQYAYNTEDLIEFNKFKTEQLDVQGTSLRSSLSRIIELNVKLAEEANRDAAKAYSSALTITVTVIIVSLIISVLLGYMIAQSIARPLGKMVTLVGKVAAGDLRETSDIQTKDEIGMLAVSINVMVENLSGLMKGVLETSQSVAAASQEISASTEEIASGSANQAQSAQSIAELFTELTSAINFVAKSAEQAAELTNSTVQAAGEGSKIVDASISGMQSVNKTMSRLEDDSRKIGEIIEVIDDIADQTNLLALNAAIEAARAGDQGRGFAVVADEVRKLAERSSAATKEISSIIKVMQENTKLSVSSVAESVTQSVQTGDAFTQIVDMVNSSSVRVNEIAAACEEQSAQAAEVMQSVEMVASASEEAAAASEETAATCQSLAQLADQLNASVSTFRIN